MIKTISYKFDDWLINDIKILVITGISGAGKSTLSEKLKNENKGVKIVNFDVFLYDNPEKYKNYEIVDAFFFKYPELLCLRDNIHNKDNNYLDYLRNCIDFIIENYVDKGIRVILEGTPFRNIELLKYITVKRNRLPSLIIVDTSTVRATYRVFKRGLSRRQHLKTFGKFKFFFRIFKNNYYKNVLRKIKLNQFKKEILDIYI